MDIVADNLHIVRRVDNPDPCGTAEIGIGEANMGRIAPNLKLNVPNRSGPKREMVKDQVGDHRIIQVILDF